MEKAAAIQTSENYEIAHRVTKWAGLATIATVGLAGIAVALQSPDLRWPFVMFWGVPSLGTLSALHVTRTLKSDPDALKAGSVSRRSFHILGIGFAAAWLGFTGYVAKHFHDLSVTDSLVVGAAAISSGSLAMAGFNLTWHGARDVSGETGPQIKTSWARRNVQLLSAGLGLAWVGFLVYVYKMTRHSLFGGVFCTVAMGSGTSVVPAISAALWYAARKDPPRAVQN